MALAAFEPESDIERLIVKARNDEFSGDALMLRMAEADLYIPSLGEVQPDGSGFEPVLIEHDGTQYVAVFTALSRQPKGMAGYAMQMNGRQFFLRLPAGFGVMFNPGYAAQILMPPHGVALLQEDLKRPVAGGRDPG